MIIRMIVFIAQDQYKDSLFQSEHDSSESEEEPSAYEQLMTSIQDKKGEDLVESEGNYRNQIAYCSGCWYHSF
jgi:hypothetical protein